MNLRFAFFGTPRFSTLVLDALERAGLLPALVVTAPDKPQGRGLRLTAPPAATWARERDIEVLQPGTLKDIPDTLANTEWDVLIVAAYARLLPSSVLALARRGCLNAHPSLLPKFRGPSPVISAILADERETGVSIMQMNAAMDAGPVVAAAKVEIDREDWPPPSALLTDLLFSEGGNLLVETLPLWMKGQIQAAAQDEARATFTKKFADADARIDLSDQSREREQFLKIRAFDHSPRAHFFADFAGERVRVAIRDAAWQEGHLILGTVVPEGKKPMPYETFLRSGGVPAKNIDETSI